MKAARTSVGVVDEVEHVGRVLAGVRPVEAGERLHGLDARQPLVHVHAAEQRLVEAGLELVRHQQDLVLVALEGLADVAALAGSGSAPCCVSVNGSGPDSLSFTSPENATSVPIL